MGKMIDLIDYLIDRLTDQLIEDQITMVSGVLSNVFELGPV